MITMYHLWLFLLLGPVSDMLHVLVLETGHVNQLTGATCTSPFFQTHFRFGFICQCRSAVFHSLLFKLGEQGSMGSRDGAVVRALAWPSHDSGPVPYVGWVCCWFSPFAVGFLRGSPVFLPPQKSKSVEADVASSLNIVNTFKFHLVSRLHRRPPRYSGHSFSSLSWWFPCRLFSHFKLVLKCPPLQYAWPQF